MMRLSMESNMQKLAGKVEEEYALPGSLDKNTGENGESAARTAQSVPPVLHPPASLCIFLPGQRDAVPPHNRP
jgi:hypothetical protein